jgi:hypothetical protein
MATTIDKSSTIIDGNLTLESVVDEETKGKIKEAVERGEAGLDGVGWSPTDCARGFGGSGKRHSSMGANTHVV